MRPKTVKVRDKVGEKRFYTYKLTKPKGRRGFDPEFNPDLTPREMLQMGVFGGVYMRDCKDEFPKSWFKKAKFQTRGVYKQDPDINYFKVNASKSLDYWRKKGWIKEQDPRGWFQWYCRYYMGRRSPDDERQIKRWRAMRRHIAQLKKNCKKQDYSCRPVQRQALLHWAYDSRKM